MLNPDSFIIEFDRGLRTLLGKAHSTRPLPDAGLPDVVLSESDKKRAAALMRVNHSGEVCAQALYQGQALTARDPAVQERLHLAAQEETEHLAWTAHRVADLGSHLSALNPLWYGSSLAVVQHQNFFVGYHADIVFQTVYFQSVISTQIVHLT